MTPAVLILRPRPGADETADRARARGLEAVVAPLFSVRPLDWDAPSPDDFDAVLVTSANAPRHAGEGLAAFTHLPAYAVGDASAAAAREAGFATVRIGPSGGAAAVRLMEADGIRRAVHFTAPEPAELPRSDIAITQVPVYITLPGDRLPDEAIAAVNAGAVVLLHSPRAAELFGDLIGERRAISRIAAISDAAASAAGTGWADVAVASEPRDHALVDAAASIAMKQRPAPPPPPAPADEPQAPVLPRTQPRKSWAGPLVLAVVAFALGLGAMTWLLARWEPAARFLGIVPEPQQVAAPRPQAPAQQPQPQGAQRAATRDSSTIFIDPDVARRVAQLEQRIGEIDTSARSAVGNADRTEGLLVAIAARRALDRGVGLGYLEGLLRQRFGASQAQAVNTIIAASRQPVTLQQLQAELAEIGPQLTGAGPNRGLWTALRQELANLIIVRRADTPSTDPGERLRRATDRLQAGQVDVALAEVMRMPGVEHGRGWIELAQRYVAARKALDTIEVASLLEPRMPTPAPPTPAAPAPAAPTPR
ncbi:uroporphyrinogen-III synthase [Sphingosinicella sp. YJ22]|uniref:uroporphyrinogen-III synthase n=1 Tax=Sphingosinicella sp. YJ22 TaxID=1104780 RepID=UPI001A9C59E0|nr:uroporphyrinogen-III synthase [Sphingosinicella sp. YJ22]